MPILDPHSLEFISRSPEQTRRVGMRLGAFLQTGDLVCLVGDLGSGKTTFMQGIASGWGSLDSVSSPSFVLVNVYRGPGDQKLFHMDAYRINGPAEAEELDLDAMLDHGPLVVEWAERVKGALPAEHVWITLRLIDAGQRDLVFAARGLRYQRVLAAFRKQIYGVV